MGQKISIREASRPERTGLCAKTLRRYIAEGKLRAYRVAGTKTIRIDTDDLDAIFTPIGSAEDRLPRKGSGAA